MKKIRSYILDMWTSHPFIVVKMAAIYYIVIYLYRSYNGMEFSWSEEFWKIVAYLFFFLVIYIASAMLNPRRMNSSPLSLATDIQKEINEYLGRRFSIRKDYPGLYSTNVKVSEDPKEITFIYAPIEDPVRVIHEINAFISILYALNTYSSEIQVEKLREYQKKAEYMIDNELEIIYEKLA